MKKSVKRNINEIRHIVQHMPKSLNEAVFEDFNEYNGITEDEELADPQMRKQVVPDTMGPTDGAQQEEVPQEMETPVADAPAAEPMGDEAMGEAPADMPEAEKDGDALNVEQFVDDIRKKSLRGMAQLAENPDDERYQLLKKIWQICDKKPEQQTAFSNPNNAVPQKKI